MNWREHGLEHSYSGFTAAAGMPTALTAVLAARRRGRADEYRPVDRIDALAVGLGGFVNAYEGKLPRPDLALLSPLFWPA